MTSLAYAALWIFVFSVPWENVIVVPGMAVISRITGMVALGFALLAVVTSARVRRLHRFHILAVLFVAWAGVGLFAIRMREIPDKFLTYVQLLLMVWMIWELATSKQRLLGLLTAYVLGAYVAAIDTIMLYRKAAHEVARYTAGASDANDHAMVLALGLPMAWFLGMAYRQPLLRWACRAYLPVAIFAIGLTGSRGGMLASIIALLVVPLTMTKLSPGRLATAVVILGLSGVLAVTYVPDKLVKRFASTRSEVEDLRFGGRFKLWMAGLRAFPEKPLVGYGTSGFKGAVMPRLGPYAQVAHNSFLSVLVEQGLVGLLLFLTMFLAVFLAVLELPHIERRFGLILLTTLIIAMLPLTWEHRKAVWLILAVLTGLSCAQGLVFGGGLWKGQTRRLARPGYPGGAILPRDPLAGPGRKTTR